MSDILKAAHGFPPAARSTGKAGTAGAPAAKDGSAAAQAWQREMERAQMTQWFKPAPKASGMAAPPAPAPDESARSASPMGLAPGATAPLLPSTPAGGPVPDAPAGAAAQPHAQDGEPPRAGPGPAGASTHAPDGGLGPQAADAAGAGNADAAANALQRSPTETAPSLGLSAQAGQQEPARWLTADPPAAPRAVQPLEMRPALSLQRGQTSSTAGLEAQAGALDEPLPSSGSAPETAGAERQAAAQKIHAGGPGPAAALHDLPALQGVRCHAQWSDQGVNVWLGMDGPLHEQARQLAWIVSELAQSLARQGQALGAVVCNGRTVFEAPGRPLDGLVQADGPATSPTFFETPALAAGVGKKPYSQQE
jgi:hypothetical protein